MFSGFALATVLGVGIGMAIGWSRTVEKLIEPVLQVLRPVPPVSWIPLAIIWFGIADKPAIFLVFLGSFFPVLLSTIHGVKTVDRNLLRAGAMTGGTPHKLLRHIVFPAALPSIFSGLRIAIGFPSAGRRAKATGECWDSAASADATFEILVRPDLAEAEGALALPVAAALARELVHAAVGIQAGRGPAYRVVARGIGLVGPMRATSPGPAFLALIAPVLDAAGPLPHARLQADRDGAAAAAQDGTGAPLTTGPRKQASRHVRCACPACGYVVRTARKWLDGAGPQRAPVRQCRRDGRAGRRRIRRAGGARLGRRVGRRRWVGRPRRRGLPDPRCPRRGTRPRTRTRSRRWAARSWSSRPRHGP